MGERRIINGAIYEKTPEGIVYVGPASAPVATGPTAVPLPVNPVRAAREAQEDARKNEDQQLQRDSADRAERAAIRADQTAQRQAAAAERAAKAQDKPTEFQSKSAGFLGRMMQAEQDFGAVPEGERGGRSLPRQMFHNVAPGLENSLVNSAERQKADQAVENFIAASLRQESGASISPAEFDRQYKIFFPAPGDSPEVLTQKANARRQAIEGFRIAAGPLADAAAGTAHQQADNEVPDPTTGADLKPPPNEPEQAIATGDTREDYSARLSAEVDSMINAGASMATINSVLKKNNYPSINAGDLVRAQRWMKDNPGQRYSGAKVTRQQPTTFLERAAASAPAAAIARGANSMTAGTVGALAGERGQGALDAMSALHPNASLGGDIVGGVTGAMGAEAALAARAPLALARFAPRMADMLYGGASGFNQAQEGEGGMDALKGAGAGLLGGVLGQRVASGVGRGLRGVRDPAVDYLRQRGIPLTAGQVLGQGGSIGRGIKKAEDALTSLPLVGNMIEARRMEGLREFNRAAFDTGAEQLAGNQITDTGAEGIRQMRAGVGNAYDNALNPVRVNITDPDFVNDLVNVRGTIGRIPNVNGARDAAAEGLTYRLDGAVDPGTNEMSGRGFQEAYRGLARTARERANGDYGHEVGVAMREGQDALAGLLNRQAPGAFDAFRAANATNRNTNVLADAVNRAKSAEDELFTPAQLNMADAGSARRLTGPLASAAGERPFYDLANAGQAVLPSKLPDSGTWTRALVGGGATGVLGTGGALAGGSEGATTGVGTGLGLTLLLAAGGSRPAQRALTTILTDRPDAVARAGQRFIDNAGVGGWTGAGVFPQLILGN